MLPPFFDILVQSEIKNHSVELWATIRATALFDILMKSEVKNHVVIRIYSAQALLASELTRDDPSRNRMSEPESSDTHVTPLLNFLG